MKLYKCTSHKRVFWWDFLSRTKPAVNPQVPMTRCNNLRAETLAMYADSETRSGASVLCIWSARQFQRWRTRCSTDWSTERKEAFWKQVISEGRKLTKLASSTTITHSLLRGIEKLYIHLPNSKAKKECRQSHRTGLFLKWVTFEVFCINYSSFENSQQFSEKTLEMALNSTTFEVTKTNLHFDICCYPC